MNLSCNKKQIIKKKQNMIKELENVMNMKDFFI